MSFLKYLNNNLLFEEDLSALPEEQFNELRKLVRKGAENSGDWANALELVHKAYEVGNIQRPTPGMKSAWTQYEELIAYAVEQLSKFHGIDGDWRMSASMFRERKEFDVTIKAHDLVESTILKSYSMDDIIDFFIHEFDYRNCITVKKEKLNHTLIEFWNHDIKTPLKLVIKNI